MHFLLSRLISKVASSSLNHVSYTLKKKVPSKYLWTLKHVIAQNSSQYTLGKQTFVFLASLSIYSVRIWLKISTLVQTILTGICHLSAVM